MCWGDGMGRGQGGSTDGMGGQLAAFSCAYSEGLSNCVRELVSFFLYFMI